MKHPKVVQPSKCWAKFNVLFGDRVLGITLLPKGPPVAFQEYRTTEEGYRFHAESYTLQDEEVVKRTYTDERDCDGPWRGSGYSFCSLANLRAHKHEGRQWPRWVYGSFEQYDYAAVSAGY